MDESMMPPGQSPMIGTPAPGQMINPLGAVGAQGVSNDPQVQMLMQALLKQKRANLLAGKLPGTTPQSIGAGTAGSDISTGPQSVPGAMVS